MFDGDGNMINEPAVDPVADTNPSLVMRPVDLQADQHPDEWRQVIAVLSLLSALGFIIATVALFLLPGNTAETVAPPATITPAEVAALPTDSPTAIPGEDAQVSAPAVLPTVSSEVVTALLNMPLEVIKQPSGPIPVVEAPLNPFTIIPDRPRNEVVVYEAVRGDTINSIAERYNLNANSIGWSNSRRYVEILFPGDQVNIPPVDGVYMTTIGSKTIAEIAETYKVEPYVIIDSE